MTTTVLPPAPATTLLEPSFVDMIAAIERSVELSAERKRHWVCSSRQIAEGLDRPLAVIPARWSAIRIPVSQLHHARLGVTAKTLANHKANVSAALRWFGKEHNVSHQWRRGGRGTRAPKGCNQQRQRQCCRPDDRPGSSA